MASMLFDVSIFEHWIKLKKSDIKSRTKILDAFVKGLGGSTGILCYEGKKGKISR
jgi:uncharacterized protein (UPF0335 family)